MVRSGLSAHTYPHMTYYRDVPGVAVIGFSFRLLGSAAETLRRALLAGRDLVTSVESDGWAQDTLLHPNRAKPGASYTFAAGSIGDVAGFDAAFFGISPRETAQMDPQQRVLLEMTWEAFEQAGIRPSSTRGSRARPMPALSGVDYAHRRIDALGAINATTVTGTPAVSPPRRCSICTGRA
jgi:phthiocerol/phenolphthiocerol synthesis type-I polyketide synthase C